MIVLYIVSSFAADSFRILKDLSYELIIVSDDSRVCVCREVEGVVAVRIYEVNAFVFECRNFRCDVICFFVRSADADELACFDVLFAVEVCTRHKVDLAGKHSCDLVGVGACVYEVKVDACSLLESKDLIVCVSADFGSSLELARSSLCSLDECIEVSILLSVDIETLSRILSECRAGMSYRR